MVGVGPSRPSLFGRLFASAVVPQLPPCRPRPAPPLLVFVQYGNESTDGLPAVLLPVSDAYLASAYGVTAMSSYSHPVTREGDYGLPPPVAPLSYAPYEEKETAAAIRARTKKVYGALVVSAPGCALVC